MKVFKPVFKGVLERTEMVHRGKNNQTTFKMYFA